MPKAFVTLITKTPAKELRIGFSERREETMISSTTNARDSAAQSRYIWTPPGTISSRKDSSAAISDECTVQHGQWLDNFHTEVIGADDACIYLIEMQGYAPDSINAVKYYYTVENDTTQSL